MRLILIVAIVLCTGCAVAPRSVNFELEHVSHPGAGWPVGPSHEEDGLSQVSALLEWRVKGGIVIEQGLGYKLEQGGFKGPALTYTGRVSKRFDFRK